jgi:hypothetical protein
MQRSEFESKLARLLTAHKQESANQDCFDCDSSSACRGSTFCANSARLLQCHYCEACIDCADCSHCEECKACTSCTHCVLAERCHQSAYLTRSVDCTGCTYCYGCVGLFGKDFHILNEPYDRESYFRIVAGLGGAGK